MTNAAHPFDSMIARLIALSNEMATARRWDDVKALQESAGQLAAQRDFDLGNPGHPIMGHSTEDDAETWSAIVD